MPQTTHFKTVPVRHFLARPSFYRLGFAVANRVPATLLYAAADVLAEITFRFRTDTVRNVCTNLRHAFPRMTERSSLLLARRIFRNFARYLVDFGRYRTMAEEELGRVIACLEGEGNIKDAFRPGRGVILVTGHIGNWELGGLFFGHRGVKINVITLPDGIPGIDDLRREYREAHNIRTIMLDGSPFASLEMMAALRRGEMVAMLIDRWGEKDGVPAEFFRRACHIPRGPFVLSRATGAAILPAFIVREKGVYKAIAEPPFVVEGEDDATYARRLGDALERVIRRYPDQWYNFVPIFRSREVSG